uniref:MD-2-related lipid-recognition domain-containing protein n=1 Tax=Amblyomma maculatum TaxID=34609 RepID=G3MKU4_AMBMU
MAPLVAILLFLGLALGGHADVKYEECCESSKGCPVKDLSLRIQSCNYDSCFLNRNSTIKITFTLTSDQSTDNAFLDAGISSWADIIMPFPHLEYNLCHRLLMCPLSENVTYAWTMDLPEPDFVNPGKRILRLKAVGNKRVMFCAKVNVTLY